MVVFREDSIKKTRSGYKNMPQHFWLQDAYKPATGES